MVGNTYDAAPSNIMVLRGFNVPSVGSVALLKSSVPLALTFTVAGLTVYVAGMLNVIGVVPLPTITVPVTGQLAPSDGLVP